MFLGLDDFLFLFSRSDRATKSSSLPDDSILSCIVKYQTQRFFCNVDIKHASKNKK